MDGLGRSSGGHGALRAACLIVGLACFLVPAVPELADLFSTRGEAWLAAVRRPAELRTQPGSTLAEDLAGEVKGPFDAETAATLGDLPAAWEGITVHHTVVETTIENYVLSHIDRGLGGLAYHLLILRQPDCNGCVMASRRWLSQEPVPQTQEQAVNRKTIAVAVVGDTGSTEPTAEQLASLERVIAALRQRFSVPLDHVRGHGEVAPNDCPGVYLQAWVNALRERGDDPPAAVESSGGDASSAPAEPPPGPQEASIPAPDQAIYDEAYTLFHQGRFEAAGARFADFLARSPNSELSDNAAFWMATALYELSDYGAALVGYREVLERYPHGNKVPDALCKAAQCEEALGDLAAARRTYLDLVERWPDAAAAQLAREALMRLDKP